MKIIYELENGEFKVIRQVKGVDIRWNKGEEIEEYDDIEGVISFKKIKKEETRTKIKNIKEE